MDEREQRIADLLHEAGEVIGTPPVRSHLVHELVECERAHDEAASGEPWEPFYARRVLARFG